MRSTATLRDQQQAGCAFVVLVGASGSGKSSLARAGVAADLIQQAGDEHNARWQVVSLVPALAEQSLFHALVRSLGDVLPELVDRPDAAVRLANGLTENPSLAVELSIKPASNGLKSRFTC